MSVLRFLVVSVLVYALTLSVTCLVVVALFKLIHFLTCIDLLPWSPRTVAAYRFVTAPFRALSRRYASCLPWQRRLIAGATVGVVGVCVPTGYAGWYVYYDSQDRPATSVVLDYRPLQIGKITDQEGRLLMRAAFEYRQTLTPDAFMDGRYTTIQNALIAAEDKRFWTHPGYDWFATVKEGAKNLLGWSHRGASAIPQQFVRGVYPSLQKMVAHQKSTELVIDNPLTRLISSIKGPVWANKAARKPREIKYAVSVVEGLTKALGSERKAKEFILTAYANMIYLGNGVYGVSYASEYYFGKDLADLTPREAACIASFIPAPDTYSTIETPAEMTQAISRCDAVLSRMADNGFITPTQYIALKGRPLNLRMRTSAVKTEAPASINAAFTELYKLGYTDKHVFSGDVQVSLTTNLDLQRALNESVADGITNFRKLYPDVEVPQAAAVVVNNSTGAYEAIFGGFTDEKNAYRMYNRAMITDPHGIRQTGSTIKIVDNVAAVMAGLTPDSTVMDVPFSFAIGLDPRTHRRIYKVAANFDGKHQGAIPWWEASAQSRNDAYLHMMHDQVGKAPYALALAAQMKKQLGYGIDPGAAAMVYWAHEMGVTSHLDPVISAVIGSNGVSVADMAEVIRTACTGTRTKPYLVSRITDRSGKTVYTNTGTVRAFPVPSEKLEMVQSLLRGNIRLPRGTGRSLIDTAKFPVQIMGKTGTSNDHRDAWFCGCTYGPQGKSIAVWVGYDDFGKSLPNEGLSLSQKATGGKAAGPIAKAWFSRVYGDDKPLGKPPSMPDSIEDTIDTYRAKAYPTSEK